ncbi:hypothetical protein KQI41_08090 [Tissierella pigra]|uniref:Lipoprotein n=1 Tax=Tissierella pigra TaxID=2607614 RepID=A0A6N7XJG4_9FIRM|nr:hypothetical protein [Tissierella pigra]MBU5426374.1 hypothetical protein [Tissierella pigra]MSU02199.1 hypothetical protein [Tissierella pigra]
MKKLYLIIISIILISLLSSCSISKFETKDKIKAPENKLPPLLGKWAIEKIIDENEEVSTMDKEALFHESAVVIGENYALNPVYKLKNVNLSDYLLYKYKMSPEDLGLKEGEVQIITVFSNNQFFNEFIKYNDDEIVSFIQDKFYFFKKSVDKISKEEIHRYINVENSIMRTSNIEEVDTLRSGILLGIKSHFYDEESQKDNWSYKTLWIRTNNRNTASIYELKDLLLPRKKGFWLVNVNRENNNGAINDKINAVQKGKFKEEINDESFYSFRTAKISNDTNVIKPSILKNILYVGNDYISTETIEILSNKKTIQVYPIDSLNDEKAIKISDVIGEDGLKTFIEGAQGIIKANSNIGLNEESFGLSRRNGYWIMKGRINYISGDEELYKDYNIKTIPPKELVNYDNLIIPWNIIKSKVPEAIDAFTSPNEDIILIVTRNNILIYGIHDHDISQKEIGKIKLNSSDSVVMAEWAIGRYTMIWEDEVIKNGAENIYP